MKNSIKFSVLSIFFLILGNCSNFKRFEQKKYFCEPNELSIELIDILETRSIKKSYLTINGKEYISEIKFISDDEIILGYEELEININLVNDEISAKTINNIFFLNCIKSNFNI